MVLQSELITLDYNPTTDVLFVVWPDIHSYSLSEVDDAIDEILRTIHLYDVTKLLIDSRRTVIKINNDMYAAIAFGFGIALLKTRVEKVARLESGLTARENQVRQIAESIDMPIAFDTFPDKKSAIEWLLQ